MPFFYVFYAAVSSVITGMARGMVDGTSSTWCCARTSTRPLAPRFWTRSSRPSSPEALCQILASTSRVLQNTEEAWSYASRGKLVPWTSVSATATNQFTGGECF